ncbi:hypothetical protein Taro_042882 [Colocasia esculenta]|uniref:Uncharacterized protein n=1 Tax=Colocasia esculenta TaxID=4460 RepID=A0A843X0E7_COLES|nr:hypothetical protein [Colocasia esculenta]
MNSHPRLALPLELHSHLDWVKVGDEQTSPVGFTSQCAGNDCRHTPYWCRHYLQTQGKIMKNWSSSVDTRSSGVDTRDSFQKTFWPIWDSVSTLVQVAADTTEKKNGLSFMANNESSKT